MNQKIVIVFSVFILSSLVGGFFLFKNQDILKQNPFLASIVKFKGAIVLSETDLIALKEKINFLESELSEKKIELEKIDDLSEENDLLNQRIIELYWEIESLELAVLEAEQIKIEEELEEEALEEAKDEREQIEEEIEEEITLCERTSGASSFKNKVIINEVAWMGDLNSANNEWIELKNLSNEEINLNGWQLQDKNQQISIVFDEKDVILSNQFYLLKRTGDSIILNVEPDKTYTGTLSNQNESLYLFDENCQLQDEVSAESSWPAGDNSSKRTMERKTNFNWQSSLNPQGTPKAENSSGYVEPVAVVVPTSSGGGSGSSAPQPQILISFPLENSVNKEIEVDLSVLNLKNSTYDIKISIEKDEVISDTYNDKEEVWQNSYNYIKEFFSGDSFNGKIKLKIKETKIDFLGEADILVKIRETGKSSYIDYSEKINITEAELEPIKEYNLTINIVGEGTTNPEAGIHSYQDLEEVIITASPSENWEFAGWTGDEEVKETEINIIMNQDKIITANFQEKEIINPEPDPDPEPDPEPQNLLVNEFFNEWQENGESADNLINWNYNGTYSHIKRNEDAYFGNYSAQWKPITSANNLTQTNINISESGEYFAEIWIKPINVNDENYIRVSLDIADPLDGSFSSADFTDYMIEDGWVKISKTRNLEMGENGGIRIRSHRQGSEESGFLIGAAWLGITEPPDDWPN